MLSPATLLSTVVAASLAAACAATPAAKPPSGPRGGMEHGMAHCPSAVPGAITGMRLVDGGVVLDITANDPDAIRAIVDRAQLDATRQAPDPTRGEHTGAHGGPGDVGHCPVVHLDTVVSVEEIAGGARIRVMAKDPARTSALQAETRERIEWLDPSSRSR